MKIAFVVMLFMLCFEKNYADSISISSSLGMQKDTLVLSIKIENNSLGKITFFGQRLPWVNPGSIKCFVNLKDKWSFAEG